MLDQFTEVKSLIFDIDGVLTDGKVHLLPDGTQMRNMNIKDGYALQLAVKKGYKVAIISGGSSIEAKRRLEGLGIEYIYLKAHDKLDVLKEYMHTLDVQPQEILYMGDDIPDFEVIEHVGVGCCPNNAAEEIKQISDYISPFDGGQGCVRDVIEKVMKLQNNWFKPAMKDQKAFKW